MLEAVCTFLSMRTRDATAAVPGRRFSGSERRHKSAENPSSPDPKRKPSAALGPTRRWKPWPLQMSHRLKDKGRGGFPAVLERKHPRSHAELVSEEGQRR